MAGDGFRSATDRPDVLAASAVRCRIIVESDLDAVIGLFRKGFRERPESYWRQGLARHLARPRPADYPTYGYLLEHEGIAVGALLTLYTAVERDGVRSVRCNLSSWYVDPPFRTAGSLLEKVATRRAEVTYFNVTPAPHTWPIQEARGFRRYGRGQMFAVPALSRTAPGLRVREVAADDPMHDLDPYERALVRDHLGFGCIVLFGEDGRTRTPLILQRRTIGLIPNVTSFGRVRCAQVIYCRALDDVARFAGPIGRHVLRRHLVPWVVLDADGPVRGLVGRFFEGRAPKYQRGPQAVPLGDLAYTELVLFGP